jgi:hypothetical protein
LIVDDGCKIHGQERGDIKALTSAARISRDSRPWVNLLKTLIISRHKFVPSFMEEFYYEIIHLSNRSLHDIPSLAILASDHRKLFVSSPPITLWDFSQ